jgi:hypothetical protein
LNKFIAKMDSNTPEKQNEAPQEINNDQKAENLEELHKKGVFGRSEYAKKDFWNERFRA